MQRHLSVGALGLLIGIAACDRPTEPSMQKAPDAPVTAAQQPPDKVGKGVWDALGRGESPAVIVSMRVTRYRDLGMQRREVAAAQNGLLNGVRPEALVVRRLFRVVPAFSAIARDRATLQRLAADPRVSRIDLDQGGRGSLANAVPFIRADLRHDVGNTGTGVVVAILDTGIDTDHPDFAGAIVGQACFGDDDGSIDGAGFCPGGSDRETGAGSAEDDAGHGTHVAGIVASRGTVSSVGVAPAASVMAIKVLNNCSLSGCFSYLSEVVAAMDYVADNPGFGVQVLSMSLGTSATYAGDCDNADAGAQAASAAVAALDGNGVTVFAASGNNGSDTEMGIPGCLSGVISVGMVNTSDQINAQSNHTPTTDILAPGVSIVASARGGGTTTLTGTSMATPMAAGCAALLIESGEATTPAAILTRLQTSSVQLTRNGTTIPRIDCGPANRAPSLTVNAASVSGDEGSSIGNAGTASDLDLDALTITASVGTIVPVAGGWQWSLTPTDGPSQSQTVTVSADDGNGGITSVTFALVVNNVAPIVDAGAATTIQSNTVLNFSGTFSDPGVNDFAWAWSIDWGFGSPTTGSVNSFVNAIVASRRFCAVGVYDVTLSVTDKDGGTGSDARQVTVTAIPVTLDITPTQQPNSVSLTNAGLLPVAVMSSATFDATTLNVSTIVLGDGTGSDTPVAKRTNGRYFSSVEDVNRDGRRDLVLQFSVPALVANGDLAAASTSLALRGTLNNGCGAVLGSDAVRIVP